MVEASVRLPPRLQCRGHPPVIVGRCHGVLPLWVANGSSRDFICSCATNLPVPNVRRGLPLLWGS